MKLRSSSRPRLRYQDLPAEVRLQVYKRLHVADRVRLNLALPPGDRVEQSESAGVDRRLALLWRAYRHLGGAPPKPQSKLMQFMKENADDPTVARIVRDHGIDLAACVRLDAFVARCVEQTATARDVGALSDADIDSLAFMAAIDGVVQSRAMSPMLYDLFVRDVRIRDALDRHRYHNNIANGSFVFDALNYFNVPLLEHYLALRHADDVVRAGFEYACVPRCVKYLVHNAPRVDFMLKRLALSSEAKAAMLSAALENLDVDIVAMLVAAVAGP